jgi:ankyrin repeat protein
MANEKIDISQATIRLKLADYLKELKKSDLEYYYDNDELIKFLEDKDEGNCAGLTALWLYCKALSNIPPDSSHPRDDYIWFRKVRRLIVEWNGKYQSLICENRGDIERFLSYIVCFQRTHIYFSCNQAKLDEFIEDDKKRKFTLIDSIAGLFDFNQIIKILENVSIGTMVYIGSHSHSLGIIKYPDNSYELYNSNYQIENNVLERIYVRADLAAETIFRAVHYSKNRVSSFVFKEFSLNDSFKKLNLWDMRILKPSLENNNKNYADGFSSLMVAVKYDDIKSVEYCLNNNANVNEVDYKGWTALHHAVAYNYAEIVKILIKYGAKFNILDNEAFKILQYAVVNNYSKTVKLLLENRVNSASNDNLTALYYAVEKNCSEIVEVLLKHGANLDAVDNDGATALYCAVENNYPEIVKLLLKNGADANVKENNGCTALHCAVDNSCSEIIKLLLENDVEIDVVDSYGFTALHYAVLNNDIHNIKLLLENGADLNIKTNGSVTVLHCLYRDEVALETIEFLLSQGLDLILLTMPDGYTAIEKITAHKKWEKVQYLIEYLSQKGLYAANNNAPEIKLSKVQTVNAYPIQAFFRSTAFETTEKLGIKSDIRQQHSITL